MGPGQFGNGGMWIIPVIFCIIMMVVCFRFFVRGGFKPPWMNDQNNGQRDNPSSESPLDILKKRYAKGEISKDQFEQMKEDI